MLKKQAWGLIWEDFNWMLRLASTSNQHNEHYIKTQ